MHVPNTVVQASSDASRRAVWPTAPRPSRCSITGNRLYADNRRTQIDMRFAKIFRFGGRRLDVGVDLQNLLNTNYATAYETQYAYGAANGGTWNNPTTILGPRFARLNFTFNY